jgi:hypothetical protein
MIKLGEDALICDLAEVYHIYNMRAFPCELVATLAAGLRDTSRVKMQASGLNVSIDRLILARIADSAALNFWSKTEDGQKNRNRPPSVVAILTEKTDESKLPRPFNSGADFDAEWRRLNG